MIVSVLVTLEEILKGSGQAYNLVILEPLNRAAVSVASNIEEGTSRNLPREITLY